MAAKIQLNFGKIGTFGWIFSTIDAFRKARHSNLIDNTLGDKWINTKYTYSYIVENLMSNYLCGGECIEDCHLCRRPGWLNPVAEIVIAAAPFITIKNRKYSAQRLYGKQNHSRQQPWTLMALFRQQKQTAPMPFVGTGAGKDFRQCFYCTLSSRRKSRGVIETSEENFYIFWASAIVVSVNVLQISSFTFL